MMHIKHILLTLILVPVLAACGSSQAPDANPMPHDTLTGPGMFSGESGNILDAFRPKNDDGSTAASIGVNGYLWRAALDTISFMPLKEVDSAGGVITTDWLTNTKSNTERYRMNVLIKGRKLAADAVQVNIFTQRREGVEWVDITTPAATAAQIEDTILTRARSLRVADRLE